MTQKMANRCSYKYSDFMKYQEVNNVLSRHLVQYCVQERVNTMPNIETYGEQLNEIITSITKGDNPNDVMFRTMVKFYINTINHNNYKDYLDKLRALDYSSKANIHYLATELIRCSISCPVSFKGFNLQEESKHKHVPEVCADIAKQFSLFLIKIGDQEISFHNELLAVCQQYFLDFLDVNKKMDEHNAYNADNYKGFMTFLGLLYARSIIPNRVILDCIAMIKKTIFFSKENDGKNVCMRGSIECNNFYKGYEHLVNHIAHTLNSRIPEIIKGMREKDMLLSNIEKNPLLLLEKYVVGKKLNNILAETEKSNFNEEELEMQLDTTKILDQILAQKNNSNDLLKSILTKCGNQERKYITELNANNETVLARLCACVDNIIEQHQDLIDMNSKFKALDNKMQLTAPFRNYVILTHNVLGLNINKLHESLSSIHICDRKYNQVSANTY